ncbi:unnamed protein product [Moneuplotes crassus]|uniref:Uncharacterized protein n=1 Tax=Euplotes crassus TaxID=5936 RepID=A0AAD1XJC6_EUPCR|nr:unnamed protein product [Moneuplotes crassus]
MGSSSSKTLKHSEKKKVVKESKPDVSPSSAVSTKNVVRKEEGTKSSVALITKTPSKVQKVQERKPQRKSPTQNKMNTKKEKLTFTNKKQKKKACDDYPKPTVTVEDPMNDPAMQAHLEDLKAGEEEVARVIGEHHKYNQRIANEDCANDEGSENPKSHGVGGDSQSHDVGVKHEDHHTSSDIGLHHATVAIASHHHATADISSHHHATDDIIGIHSGDPFGMHHGAHDMTVHNTAHDMAVHQAIADATVHHAGIDMGGANIGGGCDMGGGFGF